MICVVNIKFLASNLVPYFALRVYRTASLPHYRNCTGAIRAEHQFDDKDDPVDKLAGAVGDSMTFRTVTPSTDLPKSIPPPATCRRAGLERPYFPAKRKKIDYVR